MNRTSSSLAGAVVALCLLSGCSGNEKTTSEAAPAQTPPTSSAPTDPTTQMEGVWTADLKRGAVVAYLRRMGWSQDAQKALLDPSMAGPKQTAFRVDFVGDHFRMSQVATDIQWQSGTFDIKKGTISLDDEAPVGYLTFHVHVDGDRATFDHPASDPTSMPEFLPGVPDWGPGAVMWASVPWHRQKSQ
jgi:hypothetical protein